MYNPVSWREGASVREKRRGAERKNIISLRGRGWWKMTEVG